MRREHEVGGGGDGVGDGEELIDQMIEALLQAADTPPREVEGVSDEFCECTCSTVQHRSYAHILTLPSFHDSITDILRSNYEPFSSLYTPNSHDCLIGVITNHLVKTALDRVPRTALKPNQSCPICSNPFLDDPYPLVVRLPCHPTHLFDLECVRPWLRLRGTCPLDRVDFGKQQREKELERRKQLEKRRAALAENTINREEEEEEEWDGMYG